MTERTAIIEGTYSDLRFVKGRKVAQMVVEVPLELAGKLVEAFGTPNPANPSWVAVARLNSPTQRSEDQWKILSPKAQMLARSNELEFQKFLHQLTFSNVDRASQGMAKTRCGI
jgi:hypothetical protein